MDIYFRFCLRSLIDNQPWITQALCSLKVLTQLRHTCFWKRRMHFKRNEKIGQLHVVIVATSAVGFALKFNARAVFPSRLNSDYSVKSVIIINVRILCGYVVSRITSVLYNNNIHTFQCNVSTNFAIAHGNS